MLILVRHGQTQANAGQLLLGRSDPSLTDLGRRQAAAVAAALADLHDPRVVSSPLKRARETAATLERTVEVDDRWIEVDYGEYEGVPFAELSPDVWDTWRADPAFTPPGGESLVQVGQRVRAACADLAEDAAERDVVVVSHVSPIKAAVAWALDVGDSTAWRLFLDVAAICRIGVGPRGPVVTSYNERHHLKGLVTI